MKIIKTLPFAALAAVAVALLLHTPITLAGDHGRRGDDNERGDREGLIFAQKTDEPLLAVLRSNCSEQYMSDGN